MTNIISDVLDLSKVYNLKSLEVTNMLLADLIYHNFSSLRSLLSESEIEDIVCDFSNMVWNYPDMHMKLIFRNCEVNFKSQYPNVSVKLFYLIINMFLVLMFTNSSIYRKIIEDDTKNTENITYTELQEIIEVLYHKMESILIQSYGIDYDMRDFMNEIIDYEKIKL